MSRALKALIDELTPGGFMVWVVLMTCLVGYCIAPNFGRPAPTPPPTADWQCGLDPNDYALGECGNPIAITFCVSRCPNE